MFSTSKIDELGHVIIDKSLQQELDFLEGDALTLLSSNGKLIISKATNNCKICGNIDDIIFVKSVGYICPFCIYCIKTFENK